jgi:hypothetical protein
MGLVDRSIDQFVEGGDGGLFAPLEAVSWLDLEQAGELLSFKSSTREGAVGVFDGAVLGGGNGRSIFAVLEDLATGDEADGEFVAE